MVRCGARRLALGIVLVIASTSAISAQQTTRAPRWFLTGSVLASQDQPVRFEDYHTWQERTWDVAAGIGIGAFFSERWSWQAELEVPRRGQAEVSVGSPQLPPGRIVYWSRYEVRRRHVTAAGVLGFHPRRSGRVRPSILVGQTVALLRAQETHQELFSAGSRWQTIDSASLSSTRFGLLAGLDVETRLTRAVAIVAQVRGSIVAKGSVAKRRYGTFTLESGTGDAGIARFGAGFRWMF